MDIKLGDLVKKIKAKELEEDLKQLNLIKEKIAVTLQNGELYYTFTDWKEQRVYMKNIEHMSKWAKKEGILLSADYFCPRPGLYIS